MELLLLSLWIFLAFSPAVAKRGECGGVFTSPDGTVSSPGYPDAYPSNQDCVYVIQRPEGERITLTFIEFDFEENELDREHCLLGDVLEIRDGNSDEGILRTRECGPDLPDPFKSFSSALWLRFKSDEKFTAGGFQIRYVATKEPNSFLLLSGKRAIFIKHVGEGGNVRLPIGGAYNPVALDYDPGQGRIYWADDDLKEIRSCFTNGYGLKTHLVLDKGATLVDIAIDPISKVLFYVEKVQISWDLSGRQRSESKLGVISLTANKHRSLYTFVSSTINSMALDFNEGYLFLMNEGKCIYRTRYAYTDGGLKTIVDRALPQATGITVDQKDKRIFWLNPEAETVEWCDYEGQGRSTQRNVYSNTYLNAVAVTDHHLYVIDWLFLEEQFVLSVIRKMDKEGVNRTTDGVLFSKLIAIHHHDDLFWRSVSNGCSIKNGGCSDFCVPMGDKENMCMCPDKYDMAGDGMNCKPTPQTASRHTSSSTSKTVVRSSEADSDQKPFEVYFNDDDDDDDDDEDWDDWNDDEDDGEEDEEEDEEEEESMHLSRRTGALRNSDYKTSTTTHKSLGKRTSVNAKQGNTKHTSINAKQENAKRSSLNSRQRNSKQSSQNTRQENAKQSSQNTRQETAKQASQNARQENAKQSSQNTRQETAKQASLNARQEKQQQQQQQQQPSLVVSGPSSFDVEGRKYRDYLILKCTLTGKFDGEPDQKWKGVRCDVERYSTSRDEKTRVWQCHIRPHVPEDDGKACQCHVTLPGGKVLSSAPYIMRLNYPPPGPPKITGYKTGLVMRVGDSLRMTCTVKGGNPLVTSVDFRCPGHLDIAEDEEKKDEVRITITIERLTSSDNGVTCICDAEWKNPEMYTETASVTLEVEKREMQDRDEL